jgi:CMP-N,N'-diacetyllegionaminic acid synthase
MYQGKRILAVVPARGGSKGIKLKNLRPIQGVPMVAKVGHIVRQVDLIDRAVVSTDHEEIAKVAEAAGLDAPFRRSPELSGDRIGDCDVLSEALEEVERIDGLEYDVVVMLQPTSPLRVARHVSATVEMLVDGGWDSVWTVSPTDSKNHPLKQLIVNRDSAEMQYYDDRGDRIIARQQLDALYHRNGLAYAISRACLTDQQTIKGARTGALVTEGEFISIDTEWDIKLVEFILANPIES